MVPKNNSSESKLDDLTFRTMYGVLQAGMWLLNDLEDYLRPFNMSQGRLSILLGIQDSADGTIHPADIASMTGKSRPTVSKMISRLVQDSYITFRPDQIDARGKKLEITSKGNSLLDSIVPGYNWRVQQMSRNLSNQDKQTLIRILSQIDFLDSTKSLT